MRTCTIACPLQTFRDIGRYGHTLYRRATFAEDPDHVRHLEHLHSLARFGRGGSLAESNGQSTHLRQLIFLFNLNYVLNPRAKFVRTHSTPTPYVRSKRSAESTRLPSLQPRCLQCSLSVSSLAAWIWTDADNESDRLPSSRELLPTSSTSRSYQ